MGDGDDRPLVLLQVRFQPLDGFGVQVVRGLVQQEDVRLLQEEAAQRHAAPFAAGKRADMSSVSSPWRSMRRFISSSSMGSMNFMEMSLYSARMSITSCTPSWTTSMTVLSGSISGSCARYPTVYPGAHTTSPLKDFSTPAMILRSVDLPDPFRPMMPILAP